MRQCWAPVRRRQPSCARAVRRATPFNWFWKLRPVRPNPSAALCRLLPPILLSTEDDSQGWISFSGTSALATVRDARTAGKPAQPGDLLSLRASGLGNDLPFLVKIGEVYAEILSNMADPETAGARLIQIKLPPSTAFSSSVPVPLELTLPDGHRITSNTVTIAAEPVQQ